MNQLANAVTPHIYDSVWWAAIVADAIKTFLAASVTLVIALVVGDRLTARNETLKKKRELDLSAAQKFFDLYGEFFAVWKLWNTFIAPKGIGFTFDDPANVRWELYVRAASAEGQVEALMVKVATERLLDENEQRQLGEFRQGYQMLRQSIRNNDPIRWPGSSAREYVAFKKLACAFAQILEDEDVSRVQRAQEQLRVITSNRHEGVWYKTEGVETRSWA